MDHVPGNGSQVTMPSPKGTVTRSVTMLKSRHHTEIEALVIVIGCAQSAAHAIGYAGLGDAQWLRDIETEAHTRVRDLYTPQSTIEGHGNDRHADTLPRRDHPGSHYPGDD